MPENPNPFDIDGDAIYTILEGLVNDLTSVLLSILAGIFNVFINFAENLILGYFIANPAVILIALAIFFTAYMIWRS